MKNCFGIVLKDNYISLYDFSNECFLKKGGESKWCYDETFWDWFIEKITYQNEELSFVIATDIDDFKIPKSIKIAKNNQIKKDAYKEFIGQFDFKIYTIPKINYKVNLIHKKKRPNSIDISEKNVTVKYYKKKTKEYEGEI